MPTRTFCEPLLTHMFSTVILFCVSVPVLSEAMTVAAPSASMMSGRLM